MDIAHKIHQLVYLLDREAEVLMQSKINITYSQFLILLALNHSLSSNQFGISKSLCITASAVSRHIDNLEALNLVKRVESDKNRRTNEIVVTAKGKKIYKKAYNILDKQMQELMRTFTKGQKLNFQENLDLIIQSLQQ